jgi:hypothetical protein
MHFRSIPQESALFRISMNPPRFSVEGLPPQFQRFCGFARCDLQVI